ncbi:acetyl-CoA synthetase-like protein [Gloeophyllum trabeum ATCC 11539]|uniref:Acetyl-CoA synthetase-like protein n=1 Tax=Gloeophyllum trabeum (strain ATCC 11539 / FP-39264 / Madison 617) TaxID=670483 RepID=S7PT02_GLOTA|nr:acetyl-CoA synthetase-like protein [Gloeophyllum trabeum ATCC 11539]EPQ50946.1 acetyl-CoA synthetase-like protein [Gloeophyllum trabeum ATCC 11539]
MPGEISKTAKSEALTAIPHSPCLLPYAIDHRSYNDSGRIAISYPKPGTGEYVDVPWAQFGAAVDAAAWNFDAKIGARRSSEDPDKVVAILARSDAAYMITIYALHKCGLVPLLISTRNSRAAIVNLLKLTNSVALLSDSYNRKEAEASAAEAGAIPVHDLAPLPATVSVQDRKPFPFTLKWEDECDRRALILHTSGSTGLPKPVAWNTRFFWHQGYYPPKFVTKYNNSSVLATLPLFHGSGAALTRASLLWLGWKVTFPDPSKPVTASAIIDLCQSSAVSGPDIVIGAPSVIEEIPTLPGGMDVLRGRKFWFFVGAPVPPHFGDFLVKEGIHFLSMLGSTEIGQMNVLEPDGREPQDWQYHEIRPDLDIVLEPRGSTPDGGPFELIILAKDGWKPGTINVNINGVEGYSTSDLYQRHPTHPRLLKHCGRADDVIVLSNGEKTLSRAIEVPIEADPRVSAAIVFGTGRTQNGVLVAPASDYVFDPSDESKLAEFRNAIWPSVEMANRTSPQHSQIWKEMILVTTPRKELPRTDKGSVKRKAAIDLYAKEIDELYLAVESLSSSNKPPLPEPAEESTLVPFFRAIVEEAMGKPVGSDDDVFEQGMDSLKAIFVRNSLLSACRRSEKKEIQALASKVPQNFVFLYSSPKAMATAMATLVQSGFLADSGMETAEQHAQIINDTVAKYTSDLPTQKGSNVPADDDEVVILTGSTGSLGTFILHSLLLNARVKKVFAFNRSGSSPSMQRQQRSYKERGLDVSVLENAAAFGKLVFHDVQVNQRKFGLADDVFIAIHSSVTLVIHNAWALNFNWSLATFEPVHLKGLRNFVDFALTSPRDRAPRIAFTSSIASAGAYTKGPVPEESVDDPSMCLPQGYARSKYVGERILAIAREKTGLPTISFRIGQISGDSRRGIWNETDNVPALVRGCQELAAIPTDWPPVVAWTPVDSVAQTVVDVCLDPKGRVGMFHIANPKPTPWSEFVPVLQANLKTQDGRKLVLVKMREWLDRLNDGQQSAESNPAVKLIAFFENNLAGRGIRCRLDLQKTVEVSKTLREVPAVDHRMFETYLNYWKSISFLRA